MSRKIRFCQMFAIERASFNTYSCSALIEGNVILHTCQVPFYDVHTCQVPFYDASSKYD